MVQTEKIFTRLGVSVFLLGICTSIFASEFVPGCKERPRTLKYDLENLKIQILKKRIQNISEMIMLGGSSCLLIGLLVEAADNE